MAGMKYITFESMGEHGPQADLSVETPCGHQEDVGAVLDLLGEFPVFQFFQSPAFIGLEGLRAFIEDVDTIRAKYLKKED